MEGSTMGLTNVTFYLDVFYDDDTSIPHIWSLNILVTQPKRRIDTIFFIIMPFFIISISILMGILLDTTVIAEIFKKPTPVIVGFVAQYGLMPFLAMAIAKIFRYSPLNSLALFVIGCCPGTKNLFLFTELKMKF
jgi:predicted Na+-dependent transporter